MFFLTFFVDLRDIKTGTEINEDKLKLVNLFENHLKGNTNSMAELQKNISPSTSTQYQRGI